MAMKSKSTRVRRGRSEKHLVGISGYARSLGCRRFFRPRTSIPSMLGSEQRKGRLNGLMAVSLRGTRGID